MLFLLQERLRNDPFFLREAINKTVDGKKDAPSNRDAYEQKRDEGLFCGYCATLITRQNQRFSQEGRHLHTFFNPAGIIYEIGCFHKAPGCLVQGPASSEFCWFKGYCWQLGVCITCLEHIGWYFSGENRSFFGLIVNRLKES
ncbi:MAG: hypothetical protein CR981_04020 [Proteobacteria bacterium]|nr:MAG: hypothetical protein CR981_04020 [Pseudomonadota bacterium]